MGFKWRTLVVSGWLITWKIVSGLRTENDSGEQLHQWTIDGEQQLWASNGER